MRAVAVLVCGAGVVVVVVAVGLFSPAGVSKLSRLQEEERVLSGQVAQKRAENTRMIEETHLLRGDSEASRLVLEKKAREELGYIAPGEVVVNLSPEPAPTGVH
ncbi:MAG: septum formation initiator family protein [Deltaproteobacteria bacterium]|nr:septum formation initiator family protein [Deltaproteobacteria bacterium]